MSLRALIILAPRTLIIVFRTQGPSSIGHSSSAARDIGAVRPDETTGPICPSSDTAAHE